MCESPTKLFLVVAEEGDIVQLLARLARRKCPDLGSQVLCKTITIACFSKELNNAYLQVEPVCTV